MATPTKHPSKQHPPQLRQNKPIRVAPLLPRPVLEGGGAVEAVGRIGGRQVLAAVHERVDEAHSGGRNVSWDGGLYSGRSVRLVVVGGGGEARPGVWSLWVRATSYAGAKKKEFVCRHQQTYIRVNNDACRSRTRFQHQGIQEIKPIPGRPTKYSYSSAFF